MLFHFSNEKKTFCVFFSIYFALLYNDADDDDLRDRMSAVECLEHKWLSESSRPLKNCTKEDSTIAETITITATVTAAATENTNSIPIEKHSNGSAIIIDTNKSREVDGVSCATSSPSPPPSSSSATSASPAKPNTGFFLHQTPKNGTTLDEVLFSSLNNGFNTTAHTNTNTNGVAFKTIDHHSRHHHHHLQQHHHHNHSNHQHHNHHHHSNHPSVEHAKQSAPTVNNSCSSSINPNDTTDLLKDYATNKENINLSKILANRSSAAAAANRATLHNNNNNNINSSSNGSSINNNSNADESVTMSGTNGTTAQAKHESVLFPDAPTTPKVLRKSNQADDETPACVTLVKQFQLNNGTTATAAVATETVAVPMPSSTTSSPSSTTVQATTMRNKFANLTELARENYRISAAAITTTVATNGHHHHHSLGSSALSSALSINTLTESSVGVSQQHSNSTITISNCLCGADKTANCCCNSSSRAALNYRKKSLAVVDSSILC